MKRFQAKNTVGLHQEEVILEFEISIENIHIPESGYTDISFFILIDGFQEANLGNSCDNKENLKQIQNSKRCEEAHKWLQRQLPSYEESKFIVASGNGSELPYGCISDMVSGAHYVYWNTDGDVISADSRLRSICEKTAEGNMIYCVY